SIGDVAPGQNPAPPIPGPVKAIHSPSGDHVAFPPSAFGTGVTPLPSAFIVKSCCGPSRVESKINFPSGDHSGRPSVAESLVRFSWLSPSASITQMSHCSGEGFLPENAIIVPSGDQEGSFALFRFATVDVSCSAPEPSRFITQMCSVPLRVLTKAIFVPSGDTTGCRSKPAGLLVRFVC